MILQKIGGQSWKEWAKDDPLNWKVYFTDVMSNPNNKVVFNLDGVMFGLVFREPLLVEVAQQILSCL